MIFRNFIICIVIILSNSYAKAALNGIYTIDPSKAASASNYKTIQSAMRDLNFGSRSDGGTSNGYGVNGPATFKIAKGSYNELLTVYGVSGSSSTNTITFESATGKAEDVVIWYENNPGNAIAQILNLDGAYHLRFYNLTFKILGSLPDGRAITIDNYASYNIFKGNIIEGKKVTTNNINFVNAAIFISKVNNANNSFINNRISNGAYGIYRSGQSRVSGIVLEGNIIDSAYINGVYLGRVESLAIEKNKITNTLKEAGVVLFECEKDIQFNKNRIYSESNTSGVEITGTYWDTTTRVFVSNNFIIAGKNAVHLKYARKAEIYFNNLISNHAFNTSDKCAAIAVDIFTKGRIYNNNLVGKRNSYALFGYDTSGKFYDYNNLYTANIKPVFIASTEYSLSDWRNYSNNDAHSISVDPLFSSSYDLHTGHPALNMAGIHISGIKDDIDGELRLDNNPDIGADEYIAFRNDASLQPADSIGSVCLGDIRNVYVKLQNTGTNILKSLSINWKVNTTARKTINWTGNLNPGTEILLKLDSVGFKTALYNIQIISSKPNGINDSNAVFDTIVYKNINTLMHGEFTVGGTNADYSTIQAAISDLRLRGVCGKTTFKIRDGVYTEQLKIINIKGAGSKNNIVFKSESKDSSKVIITFPTNTDVKNNYSLSLSGANYITFQCVTFTRTGNESSSNIIDLSAGASNNSFLNCRITGRTFKHAYNETVTEKQKYSYFLVNATGDYSENKNVFRNNFFSKAYMGIYFPVYRDAYEKGNIIYGNIFDSILFSVIEVEAQDSLFVTNNRVTNCHNSGIKVSGISLVSPTFNKNFIQNNKLGILKGDVGMRVFGDAVVSNNEITFSPVKQQSSLPYGLSVGYFINAEIYYNTVYVHGDTLKGTKAFFIYGANSSAKSLKLNNNNFANFTGGLAGDFNGYRSLATSDRNNWYRVGSVGANLIDSYTSLSSWKTATGKDANSVSVDPWFLSIKNPEPQNPLISDKGIPVSGFPRDINGNYRNTGFPSIGSREFSSVYYDVGISQVTGLSRTFCSGKYNVNVWVRNYGANSINTISFGWKTDSTNQATTSWAGILKGGDSVLVNLGTADFSDAYKTPASIVKAWTIIPLYSEGDNNNDTVSYTAFGKLNGIYTVGGSAAHYKSISQAGNDLQLRGMCGPVTIKIKDGIYTEQLMLNNVDGNSIKNSFTLESESGDSSKVTWQYPSAVNDYRNFILHTEGIKSVNIRNITFRRTGELKFGTVIKIHKSDGHIVFSGNRIYGSLQERFVKIDENENILFGCFGDSFQNITLTGNLFNRGEIAVYIAGNLFSGSYYSYPKIKKEIIADNKAEDCTIGLKIAGPDSGLIQNNILHCWRMGLYMGNARKNVTVQRNKIHVIKQVERANVPFAAMYIGAFSGILINNVVSAKNVTAVHLSLDSGKVYNNSVLVYGNIKSLALDLAGGGIICNNSFVNLTGGVVFNALNQYSNFKFSYNNLYTTGVYIGYYYHRYTHYGYAYGNGNNINPSPSFPEVFVYVDPNYRSVDDLRTKHPLLDSAGVFAKFIKYDFDGNLRDTLKPDIGAFEFDTYDTDFAMHSYENTFSESCADTAFKLTVEVINHGKSSQKNIPVSAIITNGKNIVILKDTIRASVAPQTTYKHTFKNAFSTLGSGPFTVKAYTNIAGEQDRRDDTLRFEIAPRGTSPRTDSLYAVCPGKTLEIKPEKGNSTDKLHWYSDNTTSTELFTGDSFDAKNSMGDTTLFVSASNTESFNLFNKEGASGTWSYLHSFSTPSSPGAHTSFRVFRDLSIDSLTVFPRDSARFTINFYDSSKVIVFTKSYSVSVNKEGEPARISVGAALGKGFYYIGIDEIKYGLIQLSSNHTEYVRENTIRFVFNLASVGFSNLRISLPSCSESKRVPVKIKTIQRINPIISKGATFEGIFNKGDISNPDVICAGNSLSYNLATDYKNSEYNKTWLINYAAVLDSSNNSSADTSFVKPTSSANAIIAFTPSVNTKPGLYKLFITSKSIPGKCDTSITRYIRILGGAKVLNFIAGNFCLGDTTEFSVAGDTTGSITYKWTFGDGNVSFGNTAKHIYSKAGIYTAKIVMENISGCKDSFEKKMQILNKPKAIFAAPSNVCRGETIALLNKTLYAATDSISFNWEINDSLFSVAENPSYTFSKTGSYNITLKVKNAGTCKTSFSQRINTYPNPKAQFVAINGCFGDTATFYPIDSTKNSVSYHWNFGDGFSDTAKNPKHFYTKSGVYNVKLIAYGISGCKDSMVKDIKIYKRSTANFSVKDTACFGDEIQFTNNTKNLNNDTLIYVWQFGDSTNNFSQHPRYTYKTIGSFTAKLTVISSAGCTSSVSKSIFISSLPVATFTASINNGTVDFNPADTTNSTYLWEFGDGDTSTKINPVHQFKNNSNYWVKLRVINANGCEKADSTLITVKNVSVDQQLTLQKWLQVYPNPFSNHINLSLDIKQTGCLQIKLTDINGRVVIEKVWQNIPAGVFTEAIQTNNSYFVPGVYFLQLVLGDEVITKQLIKVQ